MKKRNEGQEHPGVRERSLPSALPTIAVYAAVGLLCRAAMIIRLPLESHRPGLGLLLGLTEDAGIAATLFLLASPFGRFGRRVVKGLLVVLFGLLALWSEAVAYFGYAPSRADLTEATRTSLYASSFEPMVLVRLAAIAAIAAAAALVVRAIQAQTIRRPPSKGQTGALALVAASTAVLSVGAMFFLADDGNYRNPVVASWRLWYQEGLSNDFEPSVDLVRPTRLLEEIRAILPDVPTDAFLSSQFPLSHRDPARPASAPSVPRGLKPNIVFLVMEGVRSHEIGAFGGKIPGLTPNLDRLAASGIRVLGASSPGTRTPEGEVAIWYGLLATPGSVVMSDHPEAVVSGLPEALRASGWRSFLWIHGGDQTFYRRDRFYPPRGIRMLDGRHFDPDSPRTNWGFSDKTLAVNALKALDGLPEPFAAMVLTVSNHHPFQLPGDARDLFSSVRREERGYFNAPGVPELLGHHTVPMLRTMHYTDEAVGDFFDGARSRPWFDRTLFVVTADHGIPIAPAEGIPSRHRFLTIRHGVPLIFLATFLKGGRTIPGPASLVDIPTTVLGLLGVPGARTGTGRDLLAGPSAATEERPTISWSAAARTILISGKQLEYSATVPEGSRAGAVTLRDELLVDAVGDPEGVRNLARTNPAAMARMRRIARAYLDLYPWLVRTGRSGLPPSAP